MYTVFFDSGLGGLNTLKAAVAQMPSENFIYYGDTAHVPYGDKEPRELQALVLQALDYLSRYEIKTLVLACNTATSAAADFLRARCAFPIIGMEPAIKPALARCGASGQRVLLLATAHTLKSERMARLLRRLDSQGLVDALACPELVSLAEALRFSQDEAAAILARKMAALDLSLYGSVVLGCTHFNYFSQAIKNLLPQAELMDGNAGTVRQLARIIGYEPELRAAKGCGEILLRLSDPSDHRKIEAASRLIEEFASRPPRLL